jgi:hypothetical protein
MISLTNRSNTSGNCNSLSSLNPMNEMAIEFSDISFVQFNTARKNKRP